MRQTLTYLILIFTSISIHAQSITGRVTDENDIPPVYANIILQKADYNQETNNI